MSAAQERTVEDQPVIRIFDTTLRDGEQSPGASLNMAEKLEIARQLELLNVDIIEAGFPISSPDDFEAVRAIAGMIKNCTVAALARCTEKDIVRAAEAVKEAVKPRIHVFCATSAIHRQYKLKRAEEEIIKLSVEGVKLAKSFCDDVEFSPEDASRTELPFLTQVVEAVIEAGATTVNIPDTVGYSTPVHFTNIIRHLRENVRNINKAVISVHCHNDLGLAVANSLAAVEAGARQIECTINGLGERAGNASLEEVVMAIRTRADVYKCRTRVNTKRIYPTSRLVSTLTGIHVQRNKAIVGENAFAHESGIHQHGMLANRATYEIMNPEDVGIPASKLVLGKHSGRHALRDRLQQLGHDLDEERLDRVFEQFKILADRKKEVFDEDLETLVSHVVEEADSTRRWELVSLQTTAGTGVVPTATVRLRDLHGGQVVTDAATGDGPIDATFTCMLRITGIDAVLREYDLRAVTGGRDAQGEVHLELVSDGSTFRGRGRSTDIIEASAQAFLSAINRALIAKGKPKPITPENGH
ncbi:MAG TPA: 2-isopropylmalate synthase [Phycisphaerae bacterium]|nr:2-isopropylmalate synthase [Phycisphaerae bacterium]HOJ74074.1 2-isopropylmalate synthase [Phycisphaerae bacterium]HOM50669.1 2-isopropylmalate synthase [Phycisphaerae bacterium]HOQ85091.1 2-isopropylmalate synthase [Phycisphaerae bacterium]HPP26147.1 2-isopropylmalate synthase [Phycisphaerae bacterium]